MVLKDGAICWRLLPFTYGYSGYFLRSIAFLVFSAVLFESTFNETPESRLIKQRRLDTS